MRQMNQLVIDATNSVMNVTHMGDMFTIIG